MSQEIKGVGEIVGPFGIDIAWNPESTDAEREAAHPFVTELMQDANSNAEAVPTCILGITIKRV